MPRQQRNQHTANASEVRSCNFEVESKQNDERQPEVFIQMPYLPLRDDHGKWSGPNTNLTLAELCSE